MSLLKSIKQQLGLGPAAENHFWDGSVPNQLTLKRGTPDAPGAELIKALNGVLSFPNQGQSIANPGYVKLPGGLIVQWGGAQTTATGVAVAFNFPNDIFSIVAMGNSTAPVIVTAQSVSASGAFIQGWNESGTQVNVSAMWIAIGY